MPCKGPNDPRPKCNQRTTSRPRTTPNLENHAFHAWQNRGSGSKRRRRPNYGSRLTSDVLSELSNQPRKRRDVESLPPPPPPPTHRVVSIMQGFRVVGAEDLTFEAVPFKEEKTPIVAADDSVCISSGTFAATLILLTTLLASATLFATISWLRLRAFAPKPVLIKECNYK